MAIIIKKSALNAASAKHSPITIKKPINQGQPAPTAPATQKAPAVAAPAPAAAESPKTERKPAVPASQNPANPAQESASPASVAPATQKAPAVAAPAPAAAESPAASASTESTAAATSPEAASQDSAAPGPATATATGKKKIVIGGKSRIITRKGSAVARKPGAPLTKTAAKPADAATPGEKKPEGTAKDGAQAAKPEGSASKEEAKKDDARQAPPRKKGGKGFIVLVILLAILGGGGYFGYTKYMEKIAREKSLSDKEAAAQKLVNEAKKILKDSEDDPDKYDECIGKLVAAMEEARFGKAGHEADDLKKQLEKAKDSRIRDIQKELLGKAEDLGREERYAEAAELLLSYSGPASEATRDIRTRRGEGFKIRNESKLEKERLAREEKEAAEAKAREEARIKKKMADTERKILDALERHGPAGAKKLCDSIVASDKEAAAFDNIAPLIQIVNDADRSWQVFLKSFTGSINETIFLETINKGTVTGKLRSFNPRKEEIVILRDAGANKTRLVIKIDNLTLNEMLNRIPDDGTKGNRMMRSIICIYKKNRRQAVEEANSLPDNVRNTIMKYLPENSGKKLF